MTLTISQVGQVPAYVDGARKRVVRNIVLDSSYPTGGETVTASELGLNWIDYGTAKLNTPGGTVNQASASLTVASTGASAVIQVYDETPAEIADTSDVSGTTVRVEAVGF